MVTGIAVGFEVNMDHFMKVQPTTLSRQVNQSSKEYSLYHTVVPVKVLSLRQLSWNRSSNNSRERKSSQCATALGQPTSTC
jgi:hypothetical protein